MIGELTISIIDRADEQGRLHVWHDRSIPGDRPVFQCVVESMGDALHRTDLRLGAGDEPSHVKAMGALVAFLEADAEKYQHAMGAGATDPASVEQRTGDSYIFNERTAEWAYMLADELAIARLELEDSDEAKTERAVELVARVLHREHEQRVTRKRAWTAESDIYRDSFRRLARLHIAAVQDEDAVREESA